MPELEPVETAKEESTPASVLERRAKVNEAMEKHGGNRKRAAVELLYANGTLTNLIHHDPELKARWGSKKRPAYKPPRKSETPDFDKKRSERQQRDAAYEGEVRRLGNFLSELLMSDEETYLAKAVAKFNHNHFFHTLDIIAGGVSRQVVRMLRIHDRFVTRLEDVHVRLAACKPEERDDLLREEAFVTKALIGLNDSTRKTFEAQNVTNVLMTNIRLRMLGKETFNEPQKKSKPGFSEAVVYEAGPGIGTDILDADAS